MSTTPRTDAAQTWLALLIGDAHGLLSAPGTDLSTSPEQYERAELVRRDFALKLEDENEKLRAELASWKRSTELERLKLNVLKESRAAAVEQEQVSRNECNRIRGHLLMIANECNCRAEHGAEGSDHLLAIEKMLREALK